MHPNVHRYVPSFLFTTLALGIARSLQVSLDATVVNGSAHCTYESFSSDQLLTHDDDVCGVTNPTHASHDGTGDDPKPKKIESISRPATSHR